MAATLFRLSLDTLLPGQVSMPLHLQYHLPLQAPFEARHRLWCRHPLNCIILGGLLKPLSLSLLLVDGHLLTLCLGSLFPSGICGVLLYRCLPFEDFTRVFIAAFMADSLVLHVVEHHVFHQLLGQAHPHSSCWALLGTCV